MAPEEREKEHVFYARLRPPAPIRDSRLKSALYAAEKRRQIEAELRANIEAAITAKGPKVTSFASIAKTYCEDHHHTSLRRTQQALARLLPYFGALPVMSLIPITVNRYCRQRLAGNPEAKIRPAAPATVNREITVFWAILKFAENNQIIPRNPLRKAQVPPLPTPNDPVEYFEPEEWRAFLSAFTDEARWKSFVAKAGDAKGENGAIRVVRGGGPRRPDSESTQLRHDRLLETVPVFEMLLHTGSRLMEVANLTWRDVDLRRNMVTIRQQKTGAPKTLPLNTRARAILEARPRGIGNARVFTRQNDAAFYMLELERAFAVAVSIAGITKHLTPHSIRHTTATWLITAGHDERGHVAAVLGHSRPSVTSRYAQLRPSNLKGPVSTLVRIEKEGFREDEFETYEASESEQ